MKGANENRRVLKSVPLKENENRRALKDIKNLVSVAPRQSVACKKPLIDQRKAAVPRRTKKYAVTLAIESNSCHYEVKQKHELFNEKLHIINADIPMVEEPEQMDRIVDIDSCDSKNPLAVVEYVEDIYEYYRKIECSGCVNPDYMSIQLDMNEKVRAILVDWLIEVHYKFKLMDETLYLTVNIIDRFLSSQTVARNKLQLTGITALLLACKYEEVYVPLVEDLIMITDHAYSREEVLSMEKLILKTLKFDMSVPTPYVFMRRFLKAAESDRELELLSYYVVELCLVEYKMLKFKPSMLAASAIFTAKCSLKGFKEWSKTCEVYTSYTEDRLMECSKMMVDLHRKSGTGKLVGVYKKYSCSKFGCAAKCKPALFLLDDDSISNL